MYVRQANKSEQEWLQESLEKHDLDTTDFDPLEFIFVFEESISNDPIAYGRIKQHTETEELIEKKENTDEDTYIRYHWYELTSIHYSPVVQKEKAAKYLLTALLNQLKQTTETNEVIIFVQEQNFYKSFGFTTKNDSDLTDEQKDRLDEKQTTTKKQIAPLHLSFENFDPTINEDTTELQSEKEQQGFSDEQTSTKYSV